MLGEHDYAAYCKRKEHATTVRAITRLDWRREPDGVAIATVHWTKGFFLSEGGYEYNLAIITVAVAGALFTMLVSAIGSYITRWQRV